jgi:chloramphenicol-sensitive protein RarD
VSSPHANAASHPDEARRRGLWALVSAFTIWGLLPLYLRPLGAVPAEQIMAHRSLWCCVCVLGWLAIAGELGQVWRALGDASTRSRLAVTACLITTNWLVYVWSVGHGRVVEASLGYFINPLVNVLLGVIVLRERLQRPQWLAVALAAAGVVYLTWLAGKPPFIALVLAVSFSAYGLLRKTVAVEPLAGLAAETLLIAPLSAAYLVWSELHGTGSLGHSGSVVNGLLLLGGPLTAIPLGLFAFGARRVAYATVGLFQYIGPSMQLLLGVFLYREPFTLARALGFACIWAALALYAWDGLRRARLARPRTD